MHIIRQGNKTETYSTILIIVEDLRWEWCGTLFTTLAVGSHELEVFRFVWISNINLLKGYPQTLQHIDHILLLFP
jgi:hypothetical protein